MMLTLIVRNIIKMYLCRTYSTIVCRDCQRQSSANWRRTQCIKLFNVVRTCSNKVPPDEVSQTDKSSQNDTELVRTCSNKVPPDEASQTDKSSQNDIDTKKSKEKVVKVRKKKIIDYTYTENIYISPVRAMYQYLLSPGELENISKFLRRSPYDARGPKIIMYKRADVEKVAVKKWGSIEKLIKEKNRRMKMDNIFDTKYLLDRSYTSGVEKPFILTESGRINRYQETDYKRKFIKTGSAKVVISAVIINCANTLLKFFAWLYTGSHSMFSEMIHSGADTVNQVILAVGLYQSHKDPDPDHPYGYSNLRHVSSLVSGVGIFFFGTGLSCYHGIQGIFNPQEIESLSWAIMVIAVSLFSEGGSLLVAINHIRKDYKRKEMNFWQYVWRGNNPNVTVVLLEDLAAVLGVVIAGSCMGLTHYTGNPLYDATGSIVIGGLLGVVALFIVHTNKEALLGRSIPMDMKDNISVDLETDRMIRSLHDVKATEMGGQVRFKAEVDFDGKEITRAYLYKLDLEQLLMEMRALSTSAEAEEFMLKHGEKLIDSLGEEVDRIEDFLKKKYPDIRHVDLEAL